MAIQYISPGLGFIDTSNILGKEVLIPNSGFINAQGTPVDPTIVILEYRTGATAELCEAATYQEYTVPFNSEGFVQLRVRW